MKNIFLMMALSSSVIITSCSKPDESEMSNPYSGNHTPKVCISSNIQVNKPVRAMVSNTIAANQNTSNILILNTSYVRLLEEGIVVDTLYQDFSGSKNSPFDFIGDYTTKPGKKYTIKVIDPIYGEAEGSTTTPANNYLITINSYTETLVTGGTADYRKGTLTFTITQTQQTDENYSFIITDTQEEAIFSALCTTNDKVFTNTYETTQNGVQNTSRSFISSSALIGNSATVTVDINPTNELQEGDLSDHLVLKVVKDNSDKVKYDESYKYLQTAGKDFSYFEATPIYQNVSNGYGTVMGQFANKITLIP
jgi:hypothetical protein